MGHPVQQLMNQNLDYLCLSVQQSSTTFLLYFFSFNSKLEIVKASHLKRLADFCAILVSNYRDKQYCLTLICSLVLIKYHPYILIFGGGKNVTRFQFFTFVLFNPQNKISLTFNL